jgi:hypothetical protein
MGSHAYVYFVDYQPDIDAALQALRQREFEAGRYDPAIAEATGQHMYQFKFPPDASSSAPGAAHASIDEALGAAMEDGTGSILDLQRALNEPPQDVGDPFASFLAAWPLSEHELMLLFQTTTPSRAQLWDVIAGKSNNVDREVVDRFWNRIDRGTGRYIILYEDGNPSEIFFVGFSID